MRMSNLENRIQQGIGIGQINGLLRLNFLTDPAN
jgi:hypothetical protein